MTEALHNLAESPAAARLGWTLVHFLWQGAIVAAILAVVLLFSRLAHRRHLTACTTLAGMALLPVATWFHLADAAPTTSFPSPFRPETVTDHSIRPVIILPEAPPAPSDGNSEGDRSFSSDTAPIARHLTRWLHRLLPLFTALWALGVLVMAARLLAGCVYVERARRAAVVPSEPRWQARLTALARRMEIDRPVRLLCSRLVDCPAQIGWLRPVVLVPASMLTNLTPQELDAMWAHELAHVRRHDYLVNLLQSVVEAVLFYHPAVWWVSHVIRTEREYCCDDAAAEVCGDPRHYVEALLRAGELRASGHLVALGVGGGSLQNRIERICRRVGSRDHGQGGQRPLAAFLGVALVLFLVGVSAWGSYAAATGAESTRLTSSRPHQSPPFGPKAIRLESLERFEESEELRQVFLEPDGQLLVAGRMHRDDAYQQLLIRIGEPSPVVIQLISLTEGFSPVLVASWQDSRGEEQSDADISSGRGARPLLLVGNSSPGPRGWIMVEVRFRDGIAESEQSDDDHAAYLVHVHQPRMPHWDLDPETLGVESSPILLDASGYGRAHQGKSGDAVPTINWPHDRDVFQVRANSSAPLEIIVDGTVGELDPYVCLYDGSRALLAEAPTGKPGRRATLLVQKPKPDGLYYVEVASHDNDTTGLYIVQVRQQPTDLAARP